MTHLGSWVSALADGQLSPDARERALAHVAACQQCADELATARAARQALSGAADVVPAPDLTARLLALSTQFPDTQGDPLRHVPEPVDPWAAPSGGVSLDLVPGTLDGDLSGRARRRRNRRVVAAATGGVGVLAVVLFSLGEGPLVTPNRHPAEPLTLLAQAGPSVQAAGEDVVDEMRLVDPRDRESGTVTDVSRALDGATLDWMRSKGWSGPPEMPAGYGVSAVRLVGAAAQTLEVDLRSDHGSIVLREQVGRLDTGAVRDLDTLTTGGRTVYVLSDAPWHLVWQSGDTVIDVVADSPDEVVTGFVAAFPVHGYDSGVPARISRGWTTMTGALGSP